MSNLAESLETANRGYVFTLVAFYPFDDNLKWRKASEEDGGKETYLRGLQTSQPNETR